MRRIEICCKNSFKPYGKNGGENDTTYSDYYLLNNSYEKNLKRENLISEFRE
jgi:hypothetical protein